MLKILTIIPVIPTAINKSSDNVRPHGLSEVSAEPAEREFWKSCSSVANVAVARKSNR